MRAFGETCTSSELLDAVDMFERHVRGEAALKIAQDFGVSASKFTTRRSYMARQVRLRLTAEARAKWDEYVSQPGARISYQNHQEQWLMAIAVYREEVGRGT